jgi:hypothetical protein
MYLGGMVFQAFNQGLWARDITLKKCVDLAGRLEQRFATNVRGNLPLSDVADQFAAHVEVSCLFDGVFSRARRIT